MGSFRVTVTTAPTVPQLGKQVFNVILIHEASSDHVEPFNVDETFKMSEAKNLVCVQDFEDYSKGVLPEMVLSYYKSGAHEENTLAENQKAFKRLLFLPRMLRGVGHRSLATSLLGSSVASPIAVAPFAMQRMAHPEGELATARGAGRKNSLMILSTLSTASLEDVAKASPTAPLWFQLYVYRDRALSESLVIRAQAAGYRALVLTVDAPVLGQRWADNRTRFVLPPHLCLGNFADARASKGSVTQIGKESGLNAYANELFDPDLTWSSTLQWLRSITHLPVVVKGVLTGADARLAIENGAAAVIVSNHGGRQLDTVPATIEVLSEVVESVPRGTEVYLDGGVRTGADVLKALALGARAVFVGRPVLWGLTHSGEAGVVKVLEILNNELDVSMALAGVTDVQQVDKAIVIHKSAYRARL